MLTIVSALRTEIEPLIRALPDVESRPCGPGAFRRYADFDLLRVGVGAQRAVQSFSIYLEQNQPTCVVLTGFAGALNPHVKIGEILAIEKITDANSAQMVSLPVPEELQHLRRASLLTVTHSLTDGEQKIKLWQQFQSDLVDMEAFHLALMCQERNIDCLAVKAVSDLADDTAPKQFKKNVREVRLALVEALKSFLKVEQ